jgi:hypothetical protein
MKTILAALALLAVGCSDSVRILESMQGAQGPKGDPGAQGPQGPRGLPGEAAPTYERVVREAHVAGAPGSTMRVEATCADDERPLGGGCRWGKYPQVWAHASEPTYAYDPDAPEAPPALVGWVCEGINEGDHDESITAFAICEKAID